MNVNLDCSGFSAALAHIKLAAIIIIIQTMTFFHDQLHTSKRDQEDFNLNSIIVYIGMCPCMPEIASAPTTSNNTSAQIILVHVIIAIASRHYIQGH